MSMQSFIFGAGTDAPTYESLKRRRNVVDALQGQVMNGTPRNATEGIMSIAKALMARHADTKLGAQEDAERQRISDALMGMGGMGTPTVSTRDAGGLTAGDMAPQGGSTAYRDAISSIESSGNYGAMGPETGSGDRAYGKYQVMGANIPDWSEAALGQRMTPDQFLANPQAQDAVFDHRFGGYVDQYGPAGAANAWFTGSPTPSGKKDVLGTSDHDYTAKFMAALTGEGSLPPMGGGQQAAPDMARVSQLAEVLSNPYATPGQQMVAKALLERALPEQMTPYQQQSLDLQRINTGLDAMKADEMTPYQEAMLAIYQQKADAGNRGNFGLTPVYAQGPDGQLRAYQTSSSGGLQELQLPGEGASWAPGVQNIQTPTAVLTQDKAGNIIGSVPKDNAGAARDTGRGKIEGETQATAAAGLPNQAEALSRIEAVGNEIINDPGLEHVLGPVDSKLPRFTQARADTQAKIDRFLGQTFPMAMESLRGLGPATQQEGQAAQAAIASLGQAQSPEQFKAAINEALMHIRRGYEIAQQKASGGAPQAPQAPQAPVAPTVNDADLFSKYGITP